MPAFISNWRAFCFPKDAPHQGVKLGVSLTTALKPRLTIDLGKGVDITVVQDHTDPESLGSVAWDSSIYACKHLSTLHLLDSRLAFDGKKVLELGSGTGLLGIACAKLGAKCTMTDKSTNLTKASVVASKVDAACIDYSWGESVPEELRHEAYDFIICSDVLYDSNVHSKLIQALATFWTPEVIVLIAYKRRWAAPEQAFFKAVEEKLSLSFYVYSESKEDSMFLLVGVADSLSTAEVNLQEATQQFAKDTR